MSCCQPAKPVWYYPRVPADQLNRNSESQPVILPENDPQIEQFLANGYQIVARSHGAQLNLDDATLTKISMLCASTNKDFAFRELNVKDICDILKLDGETANDYPGDVATLHESLNLATATPTDARRAFGAYHNGELIAMIFLNISGSNAEIDFCVVAAPFRRQGIATALGAYALHTVAGAGVKYVRTGFSADNPASIAAFQKLGQIDENWVTLRRH